MRALVTGSSGHLGEALVRMLRDRGCDVVGLDVNRSAHTSTVGSVTDRDCVRACMAGADVVYHAATLHKPHIATHSRQDFVDTNIHGTLVLLEEAVAAGVRTFVFTSTTSVFGEANRPAHDAPAAWVTEATTPIPRNIYGVTKSAAEDLCQLFHRTQGIDCIVLRTSRFFLEADDDRSTRTRFADGNVKVNEFVHRRVDIEDVVSAHLLARERAPALGFGVYIISATTPFARADVEALRKDAPRVLQERVPEYEAIYKRLGWSMFQALDRVYVNDAARRDLRWRPRHDFATVLRRLDGQGDAHSALAGAIGKKGYHDTTFEDGPYPVEC